VPGTALLSYLLSRLTSGHFTFLQPKAIAGKGPATKHKFVIDFSKPASDGVFDGADFEKFLHDRIKVEGKAGQLGENVKITRDSSSTRFVLTFGVV
jgi:large subunit ribosomal protein L22e